MIKNFSFQTEFKKSSGKDQRDECLSSLWEMHRHKGKFALHQFFIQSYLYHNILELLEGHNLEASLGKEHFAG